MGERVLLIGGAGFLGSALARRLLAEGYDVHVLLRQSRGPLDPAITVHAGGLGNIERLRHLLPSCQAVVHLASGTNPGVSARDPTLEAELNIFPSLRFLEVLQSCPDVRLIYLSSGGAVYGNPLGELATEDTALAPLSYYAAGKVAIETFLLSYARSFERQVVVFRPSNLYGPGQPFFRGFGLIRTMLQHVIDDSPMEIWGDGEVVRDFIYIDDLVEACRLALDRQMAGGVYNVGTGEGHSLNQVRAKIEAACGRPMQVRYRPGRRIDVSRIVLDSRRLAAAIPWTAQVKLDDGIARTWDWLKNSK